MFRLYIFLLVGFVLGGCSKNNKNADAPWSTCFDGLYNKPDDINKIYATSGRMARIIGTQNGLFPDMGSHVTGEMGGIWAGSFKLLDGYWMSMNDGSKNTDTVVHAKKMTVYPHKTVFDMGTPLQGIKVLNEQFASDVKNGVIISYFIENTTDKQCSFDMNFIANIDLSPVWFSTENGIGNTYDIVSWDGNKSIITACDSLNNWNMALNCSHKINSYKIGDCAIYKTQGKMIPVTISSNISLKPGGREAIHYAISYSIEDIELAQETSEELLIDISQQKRDKEDSIKSLLSSSQIELPDKELQDSYYWTIINTRWLETCVDTIGLFQSAGAVEYPWLFGCDNSYALQGLLRTGNFEVVKSTLKLLNRVSNDVNGDGRIIHEMSNNGYVGNKGNTQETAHYVMALWNAYEWTGDIQLIKEIYPNVKKSISWLTETMDTNGNLFPEGYGIMEVKGLNAELIDVAVYTQQALEVASKMAAIMQEKSLSQTYLKQAEALKQKINSVFWDEESHSYCDFYAKASDAVKVVNGAIEQIGIQNDNIESYDTLVAFYQGIMQKAMSLSPNTEKGWFTNKNWVINTPMECGIAPVDKALKALDYIDKYNCGTYGPYLSAVERNHMMTISTGVQAVAEARYNRIDQAIKFLRMITATLGQNMPGAINEMMPDYGCPYQAWTIYGMAKTLISGCFGVYPQAYNKKIYLYPQMPKDWNQMSIKNLRIGDNSINLCIKREANEYIIEYSSLNEGWNLYINFPQISNNISRVKDKEQSLENDFVHVANSSCKISIPIK